MIGVLILAVAINVVAYSYVIFEWKADCKTYGKDNLAVSLGERLGSTFVCVTCPCIIGMLLR